jgi:hypothetical protein
VIETIVAVVIGNYLTVVLIMLIKLGLRRLSR